jgi:hypothetical protein
MYGCPARAAAQEAYRMLLGLLERDSDLSSRAREAILAATTDNDAASGADASLATRALALDAALTQHRHPLTPTETALLYDWLHRIATTTAIDEDQTALPG